MISSAYCMSLRRGPLQRGDSIRLILQISPAAGMGSGFSTGNDSASQGLRSESYKLKSAIPVAEAELLSPPAPSAPTPDDSDSGEWVVGEGKKRVQRQFL